MNNLTIAFALNNYHKSIYTYKFITAVSAYKCALELKFVQFYYMAI